MPLLQRLATASAGVIVTDPASRQMHLGRPQRRYESWRSTSMLVSKQVCQQVPAAHQQRNKRPISAGNIISLLSGSSTSYLKQ